MFVVAPPARAMSMSGTANHASMHPRRMSVGNKVRTLAHHGKPIVEIELDKVDGAMGLWITSYSTMDTIEGIVWVTAPHDTPFQDIQISFIGKPRSKIRDTRKKRSWKADGRIGASHVFVDRVTAAPPLSGRTEATHRFLQLKQPIAPFEMPPNQKLLAGTRYGFRFTFTIPAQLLPRACTHPVANDAVRERHLQLPPSMGDPDVAGFGGILLDDLAPEMSKVMYYIQVRIIQGRCADGVPEVLVDKCRKVRVKPAFEEQPPLDADLVNHAGEYRFQQEKTIRKGMFKGKLGTLTAQTAQPKALMIPGARSTCNSPISTIAKVLLRFDPADEANLPPRLGSLVSRIKVNTFYASTPVRNIPTRAVVAYDMTQGLYGETVPLSTLCVASAQWQKHKSGSCPSPATSQTGLFRRDSGVSNCSTRSPSLASNPGIVAPSSKYIQGSTYYTAEILVPITLPMHKNFLPTFHSCLISRSYTLSLQISAQAGGIGGPSLHLKVPIQIAAEGSDTGNENARMRNEENSRLRTDRDILDMFTPRNMSPRAAAQPDMQHELPPEYTALSSHAGRQAHVSIRA